MYIKIGSETKTENDWFEYFRKFWENKVELLTRFVSHSQTSRGLDRADLTIGHSFPPTDIFTHACLRQCQERACEFEATAKQIESF
jgi:hypothetical protein